MTTHDKDKIIALRNEADKFATEKLLCEGEYHPDFHTVSDERFYAIAFDDGRQDELEECAKVCEALGSDYKGRFGEDDSLFLASSECADAIRARGDMK